MSLAKVIPIALFVCTAVAGVRLWTQPQRQPVRLRLDPSEIAADGDQQAFLTIDGADVPRVSATGHPVTLGQPQRADGGWRVPVQAGIEPGAVSLRVGTARVELALRPEWSDRESDGTPDALRLDTEEDRRAFRRWFTFLSEVQLFQESSRLPAEINDCAALIRYAYREALRRHDAAWARDAKVPVLLSLESVAKYQYPHTLLGAALFRVRKGPVTSVDAGNGAFAQFADAKTLQTLNTHFITRDLDQAEPGDLLFFRHESADMPFHGMIYLGRSQVREDGQSYVIYHTGPDGSDPGEIRRPSVDELSSHPNPGWRPLAGNPTFLGVYRWNILR
jgi:uncharacterized protein YfaT (DUF1175 family)